MLATVGVFLLFALAAGIVRISGRETASPLIKAVVDGATEGILVTDARGRVVYANAAYLDLVDAADANDVRPVERVFIGDPGVSEAVYRLLKAAREGRRLQEEVRVGGHKAGEPGRWLRMRVRPLGAGKREQRLTVWSLADVTRELERHENVFQELQHAIDYLDHAPAGFFSAEGNGNIVYLNATLANWLDHDLAQVGSGGLKLGDIVAGEGAALLTTFPAVARRREDRGARHRSQDPQRPHRAGAALPQGRVRRRRGARRLAHARAQPRPRRRHRPAARRRGAVRAVLQQHADGDRHRRQAGAGSGCRTPCSPACSSRCSRSRASAAARSWRWRPSATASRSKPRSSRRRTGRARSRRSTPRSTAPGERFARFYVTAIEEEDRDQEAAIVYALETTEQRKLQGQVDTAQTMELVGKLAGGVAHDFNNVLGAIIMATDFLLNAHKPTDPSFQDIMQIKQNANRAAALVRQLLAFSRKQTLRPQVVDLNESLSDLGLLLRRFLGEKVSLNVVHGRDLYPVKIDIAQFERSVINLAANARDAMADGGKFTLRTSNVGAEESTRFQYKGMPIGEYVLVEVEDTGSGIAPEIVDRIFQPYFTTKDVGKGTGLGLSTVYGFVKQTGGFIYVASEVGKGSTFRIFLPRYIAGADDVQPPQLPETASPAIAGAIAAADEVMRTAATDLTGEGTILLVEDEEGLRALNARGLASRGYTVIEAGNGVEALEELEKQGGKVDLVVSDVVMPEMDGPTLLTELRKRMPEVKIIFVSGYAEDAFEKSLPDARQYEFLPKPFTLKQLVAKVKDTMAKLSRRSGSA